MYKIKIIEFKKWTEYEDAVNNLYKEGWEVDETLNKQDFGRDVNQRHIIRFKKNK